jgi:TRAP-type mannitol/chloroaromatic compound transport system substrate-binding protein
VGERSARLNLACKIQENNMTLLHRIKKIEDQIQPLAAGAILLHEPAEDAGKEAREAFDTELAKAIEAGHQVIVHTSGKYPCLRIAGVIYESGAFDAMCALMAHTPATDGRSKNKLCQIIAEAQGTTLPIVREVRNGAL